MSELIEEPIGRPFEGLRQRPPGKWRRSIGRNAYHHPKNDA